jgi:hypothetical protein
MSVILVEGPDGGGKTQTAKTIFKSHTYQHNGPPPAGSPADVFWWQLEGLLPKHPCAKDAPQQWVVDRNWPSEQIYHRFAGRPHVFHPMAQRMFERYMLANRGVVVMCLPPYGVAYEYWRKRADEGKELLVEDAQFATMYDFYKSWQRTTSLPTIEYDWTIEGPKKLQQYYHHHREYLSENTAPCVLYGNPAAHILIVGEQYNIKKRPLGPHIPFVGTGHNGFWLTQQLEMIGLRERDLAWVNAIQPDGSVTPTDIVAKSSTRVIVALGEIAHRWAQQAQPRNGCKLLAAPHPAYWARFKSKEQYPLHEHALFLHEVAKEF